MCQGTAGGAVFFLFFFLTQNIYAVLRGDLYNTNVV